MIFQTDLPDKIDTTTTAGVTYLGYAKAGTIATSQANWAVIKITEDGVTYANGMLNYENVWDNRTSLTYEIRKF